VTEKPLSAHQISAFIFNALLQQFKGSCLKAQRVVTKHQESVFGGGSTVGFAGIVGS